MTTDTWSVCQTWFLDTYCTNTSDKFRQIGYENRLSDKMVKLEIEIRIM